MFQIGSGFRWLSLDAGERSSDYKSIYKKEKLNHPVNDRLKTESFEQYYDRLREKSDREDLVMFINASFAATQQNEYYTDQHQQSVTIDFLHQYVMTNYRRLYARAIAAGINHFNQQLIVFNLLKSGAPADPEHKAEEGELIATALRKLPANRVFGLFKSLQTNRVNNRRTRAVIDRYLKWRKEPAFDAVKYRQKYKAVAAHAHLKLENEFGSFLFDLKKQKIYETDLFDKYRQAHYSAAAIYNLPFTVAESLAQRHGVPRDVFFEKIEHKMTAAEKLRFQTASARSKRKRTKIDFDLAKAPLTKLALYVLSLPVAERIERAEEFDNALKMSANRTLSRSPLSLGKVVAVLDRSRSSVGSRAKRNRPHAVAIAATYVLRQASTEYRSIWTCPVEDEQYEFIKNPTGQTCLADPLIDAFELDPDLVVIVSDGYENDPPMAADQIVDVFKQKIAGDRMPEIIHMNPVFDSDHFSPRPLGRSIATVGLRDAEDISTMLGFARFASGAASLSELESYLASQVKNMLGHDG